MLPGMNKKMLEKAMKQMGVKQEEIEASEVIIKLQDKELIIRNPQVSKVNMMGQDSFQISGDVEENTPINEENLKLVMTQAEADETAATQALLENKGDIAKAIIQLKGE